MAIGEFKARPSREVTKQVLPNGLVVITEPMAHVRSAAVGIWIRGGSRREPAELAGISHFIEHMVFKGTERRSAEEIAHAADSVGGMLDAFTSKEMVCFNAKVLDQHLPLAFDVVSDLMLRPRFAEEDVAKEKSVILEEIKMEQDDPEYLVHELFAEHFWKGHPLGRPIMGTRETVKRFDRAVVLDCFRRWYVPSQIVVTGAGSLGHGQLVELVQAAFGNLPAGPAAPDPVAPQTHAHLTLREKRELEQVHVVLGVPALPMADEKRYALAVLNTILGAGMSSRLFQNIRERQALAYAVFSELAPYGDAGLLSVYAGTALETVERVIHSVAEEFRNLKEQPIPPEELRRAKEHLKGSLMLSLESTQARMANLARQELYFGRFFTPEEVMAEVEAVTADQVQSIAQGFFQPERIGVTVLGNLGGFQLTRDHLAG